MNDNWSSLVIDGPDTNIQLIKQDKIYCNIILTAISYFIDSDNINYLIEKIGNIPHETELLHIDIDGNDYWIWKKTSVIDLTIVNN